MPETICEFYQRSTRHRAHARNKFNNNKDPRLLMEEEDEDQFIIDEMLACGECDDIDFEKEAGQKWGAQ